MSEFVNDVQDWAGDNAAWLWVGLGVIVALAVLGALAALLTSKKRERDRKHAAQIRHEEQGRATRIDAKDAETRRLEAEAEQARAEADRLQAIAADKRNDVESERQVYVERMQEADELDKGRGRADAGADSDGEDPPGAHSARR